MKRLIIVFCIALSMLFSVSAMAEEETREPAVTDSAAVDGEREEYENIFETLLKVTGDALPEILSLITLSASLVLAFAFKRGLIPLLTGALGKIGDSVTHIEKKGDENGKIIDTLGERVDSRLETVETLISELSEKIKGLGESLTEAERRAGDREKLATLINGQIDMLYEVFMSSSLPHFQKEAVGERIAEMREALADNDGK